MNSPTAYMRPETARALLALSRERTARLRARRALRESLRRCGWPESHFAEMIAAHERLQGSAS
jgi:hypothetical protein